MANQPDTNDMSAYTESQLEYSLDAMLFDPSFSGADMSGSGDDSMMTGANDGGVEPSTLMALHEADAMQMPVPLPPFSRNQQGINFKGDAVTATTSCASSLSSLTGGGGDNGSFRAQTGLASTNATTSTSTVGRPQLFGKELPFTVPALRTDPSTMATKSPAVPSAGKRKRAPPDAAAAAYAISEDESDKERRRQDRNQREQQRSQQISHQIAVLKELLDDANVECKPDKYSTLASVVDFVIDLQQQASTLESEHSKLLDTIRQTTEIMSTQYMSVQAKPEAVSSTNKSAADVARAASEEQDQACVRGLDYRSIFRASPFALATTSIDGRFLDVSSGFEELTKFKREELLPLERISQAMGSDDTSSTTSDISSGIGSSAAGETNPGATKNLSLFNVLFPGDMSPVYHAMYDILQQSASQEEIEERDSCLENVRLTRNREAQVSQQRPKC